MIIGPVVVGNVGDNNVSMHLKHNSWPTPHPSVKLICVELLRGSRQPMTDRLATHPSNTTVETDSERCPQHM